LVVEALSLNCFKTRLCNFWSYQDVLYDIKAPSLGTGSRIAKTIACALVSFVDSERIFLISMHTSDAHVYMFTGGMCLSFNLVNVYTKLVNVY